MRETKSEPILRILRSSMIIVGVIMVLYHFAYVLTHFVGPYEHQDIHLGFSLILVGLLTWTKKPKLWPLWSVLLVAGVVVVVYIFLSVDDIYQRPGTPTMVDIIFGWVLLIVVIVASWLSFGFVLPVFTIITILYGFFGHLIGPPFGHAYEEPGRVISYMGIGLRGMFGEPLDVSANYIFLFIIFGALLMVTGATGFFIELGGLLNQRFKGAPVLSAVLCSALIGMTTGQASGNIALVGSFTIPWMKKAGLSPNEAAAIEAAASTGGQVMPPIMGASAFLMAVYLGIPYIQICAMAAIPALLYYLALACYGQFMSVKLKLQFVPMTVNIRELLLRAPLFVVPLAVLMAMMINGFSAMMAGFWATVTIIALSLLRKQTRPKLMGWLDGAADGAKLAAEICVAIAVTGPMIAVFKMTGLGMSLATIVEAASGGSLGVALLLTMVVAIILGTGLPTIVVYVIVALMVSPALVRMGISMEQSHFFAFYYGVFANLTPPVAMAPLVAAKMAGGDYMKTCWISMKAGASGLILPFLFIYCPGLLLLPSPLSSQVIGIVSGIAGFVALSAFFAGAMGAAVNNIERGVLGIISLLCFGAVVTGSSILFASWIIVFALLLIVRLWKGKRRAREAVTINSKS